MKKGKNWWGLNQRMHESATTSRAGGMRMAPGRGRDRLCWWPLILIFFLISVLSDLLVLMSTGPINHWQVSCLPQPALVVVVLLAHANKL
jgi:hypothetical protein